MLTVFSNCAVMLRIVILVMFLAGPVIAGPDRLGVHLGSYHAGATDDFEEVNPGLFLSWDRPHGVTYSVGAYRNSYGRGSLVATVAKTLIQNENAGLGVFAGLAHYPGNGSDIRHAIGDFVPLVGLQMRYRHIFVNVMPGDGNAFDAVFSFGITVPLGTQ